MQVVPHDAQIQSKGKAITRKGDEENPGRLVVVLHLICDLKRNLSS